MRDYIKKLRDSAKMTQDDIAKKLGISRAYYVRIENGERQKDLDLSLVLNLSKIFGVPVDYIIAEEAKLKGNNV